MNKNYEYSSLARTYPTNCGWHIFTDSKAKQSGIIKILSPEKNLALYVFEHFCDEGPIPGTMTKEKFTFYNIEEIPYEIISNMDSYKLLPEEDKETIARMISFRENEKNNKEMKTGHGKRAINFIKKMFGC